MAEILAECPCCGAEDVEAADECVKCEQKMCVQCTTGADRTCSNCDEDD